MQEAALEHSSRLLYDVCHYTDKPRRDTIDATLAGSSPAHGEDCHQCERKNRSSVTVATIRSALKGNRRCKGYLRKENQCPKEKVEQDSLVG
jgi:hypothetical protein